MTLTIPAPANFDWPPHVAVPLLTLVESTAAGDRRPEGSVTHATDGMEGNA